MEERPLKILKLEKKYLAKNFIGSYALSIEGKLLFLDCRSKRLHSLPPYWFIPGTSFQTERKKTKREMKGRALYLRD